MSLVGSTTPPWPSISHFVSCIYVNNVFSLLTCTDCLHLSVQLRFGFAIHEIVKGGFQRGIHQWQT